MINNFTTSDEILGKDVLDINGRVLGIVQKMHIDRRLKKIVGVTVDEGFMKPQLYVGVENIKFFGLDAVILNIEFESYVGLKVFDSEGNIIGSVKKILKTKTGKLQEIMINTSDGIKNIRSSKIKSMGENVILK